MNPSTSPDRTHGNGLTGTDDVDFIRLDRFSFWQLSVSVKLSAPPALLEIRAQGADEIVGGPRLFVSCGSVRCENVIPNVPFDDLGH